MKIKSKPIKSQVKIDITYKNILILPGRIDNFLYIHVIIRYAITGFEKAQVFFSIFQTFNNVKNYSHLNIEINCSFPLSFQPNRDRKRQIIKHRTECNKTPFLINKGNPTEDQSNKPNWFLLPVVRIKAISQFFSKA